MATVATSNAATATAKHATRPAPVPTMSFRSRNGAAFWGSIPTRNSSSSAVLRPKEEYYSQCYSISSWFRLPEQGMDDFELLSRASGFLIARQDCKEEAVHIVSSAHVVHPFAFPNYYPVEEHAWLKFVNENNVLTKFEIRERTGGEVIFSMDLHEKVFRHDTRDVCVLHPENQQEFLKALRDIPGHTTREHILQLENDEAAREKSDVMFVGHQIIEASGALQEQLPTVVGGRVLGCTPHGQAFASTDSTLQMGMCGGPVLNASGLCIGATEGLVPATGPEPLRLCAAVITADTVGALLADVESQLRDEFPPR